MQKYIPGKKKGRVTPDCRVGVFPKQKSSKASSLSHPGSASGTGIFPGLKVQKAVNSREALYNSGWPEAWVVQGGLDASPLYTPLQV